MNESMHLRYRRPPRRRVFLIIFAVLAVIFFSSRTVLSYYVGALWFGSLGYADVFQKSISLQWLVFAVFFAATFFVLYGWFLALWRTYQPHLLGGGPIFVGGRPIRLPVERILRPIGLVVSLGIAFVTATNMMLEWSTFALYWYAPRTNGIVDPIFGRPLNFYLFTLPAWQFITGWLLTMAVITCVVAIFFIFITGSIPALGRRGGRDLPLPWRGFSIAFAFLLLTLAMRVYVGRFDRLFDDHTIFGGVTYTDAHVVLTGLLVVCIGLVLGAAIAAINFVSARTMPLLFGAAFPAAVCYVAVHIIAWYVGNFVVKPNELVRERPFIAYNIDLTRQAFGLDRMTQREFPAETTVEATDPANNQATLQNIRLWDW